MISARENMATKGIRMNEEQVIIKETLESLGIDTNSHIVISNRPHMAERTAARELKDFLKTQSVDIHVVSGNNASRGTKVLLGRMRSLSTIKSLSDRGDLKIGHVSEKDDGYHLKRIGDDIVIAGANARGVLYGTYRLIEWIKGYREEYLDIFETPYFRQRWLWPSLYARADNRAEMTASTIYLENSSLRYLAKLGANVIYLGSPSLFGALHEPSMSSGLLRLVSENKHLPTISQLRPPYEELVNVMDKVHSLSSLYGFANALWIEEPQVAEGIHADLLNSIPEDCVTVSSFSYEKSLLRTKGFQRLMRQRRYHSLCMFHPKVEKHYKSLITQLVSRYPNLQSVMVYNEDTGSSNCYAPSCPRCRQLYPEGYAGYPYLAHTHGARIMQEAGQEVNKEFRIATATYHWFGNCAKPGPIGAADRKHMIDNLPPASIVCCLNTLDSQVSACEIPSWAKDIIKRIKDRGDLSIFALDDFTGTSEDLLLETTAGFPIPYRTYKKLHNWAKAGIADGITAHPLMGHPAKVNSINDIAFRIFSWQPLMSYEEADNKIKQIALLQLRSEQAASEMVKSYKAVDKALDVWAKAPLPYTARLWHGLPFATEPLSMDTLAKIRARVKDIRVIRIEGEKIRIKRVSSWLKALTGEIELLEQALMCAGKAAELAPDDTRSLPLWRDEKTPGTCSDYAQLQAETIEIVMRIKISFANFIRVGIDGDEGLRKVGKTELDNTSRLIETLKVHRKWMEPTTGHATLDSLLARLQDKKKYMEKELG